MNDSKKFYLVYELKAENVNQVKAIAVDLYNRDGISPTGIFEKTDFNLIDFINDLKSKEVKG